MICIVEKQQTSSLIFMEFGMKILSVDYKETFLICASVSKWRLYLKHTLVTLTHKFTTQQEVWRSYSLQFGTHFLVYISFQVRRCDSVRCGVAFFFCTLRIASTVRRPSLNSTKPTINTLHVHLSIPRLVNNYLDRL